MSAIKTDIFSRLPEVLLPWYRENRRELPWRQDKEPYHIWVSEIMLQQTRVEAAKGYYARFLKNLPDVAALANCDDDALHKLWEGLGYYSRVRNLKKAALQIMESHGGVFPTTYQEVRALPGIGDYTAGAVCSIAFGQKTAAVDGNVLRVIARLTEDNTPIDLPAYRAQVRKALEDVYPDAAGDFTQALMELGATLCGPNRKPDCESCPCGSFCGAALHGTGEQFPVRLPKSKKRVEERTLFVLSCEDHIALSKRPAKGLLADLWEFPNISGHLEVQEAAEYLQTRGIAVSAVLKQREKVHIFTHIRWEIRGFYMEVKEKYPDFQWFTRQEVKEFAALPTAFRQFFEEDAHV